MTDHTHTDIPAALRAVKPKHATPTGNVAKRLTTGALFSAALAAGRSLSA